MKLSRTHWCTLGFLVLFLGIQFHLVDAVTLTSDATEFLAQATNNPEIAALDTAEAVSGTDIPVPPYQWFPRDEIQHILLTAGFVLVFTSLAMRKT